jgi:hypothetical protein
MVAFKLKNKRMSSITDEKASCCWSEFTVWSYSSFPQYLTIKEKQEIFLHSWVPGDAGYWLLFSWRLICMCFNVFFCLVYWERKQGDGFQYLSNWGFWVTACTYLLFMI